MGKKLWIQKAHLKKGALHRVLGINENEKIPKTALHAIKNAKTGTTLHAHGKAFKVSPRTKKMAQFALEAAMFA